MKPVSRLRLVLGKYTAVLLVTVPALIAGLVVTTAIAAQGPDPGDLGRVLAAMAGASAAAAALLAAVFLLVSLVIPRALLAGMITSSPGKVCSADSCQASGHLQPGVRVAGVRRDPRGRLRMGLERGADDASRCRGLRCLPCGGCETFSGLRPDSRSVPP